MLCNKGENDLHLKKATLLSEQENLWNICKWQDLQMHLKHKQGKMFSNNIWSGREKHWGSHQEEGISQGGTECQGLTGRLTIRTTLAQRRKPTHTLSWSVQPLLTGHRHGHASIPAGKTTQKTMIAKASATAQHCQPWQWLDSIRRDSGGPAG